VGLVWCVCVGGERALRSRFVHLVLSQRQCHKHVSVDHGFMGRVQVSYSEKPGPRHLPRRSLAEEILGFISLDPQLPQSSVRTDNYQALHDPSVNPQLILGMDEFFALNEESEEEEDRDEEDDAFPRRRSSTGNAEEAMRNRLKNMSLSDDKSSPNVTPSRRRSSGFLGTSRTGTPGSEIPMTVRPKRQYRSGKDKHRPQRLPRDRPVSAPAGEQKENGRPDPTGHHQHSSASGQQLHTPAPTPVRSREASEAPTDVSGGLRITVDVPSDDTRSAATSTTTDVARRNITPPPSPSSVTRPLLSSDHLSVFGRESS